MTRLYSPALIYEEPRDFICAWHKNPAGHSLVWRAGLGDSWLSMM